MIRPLVEALVAGADPAPADVEGALDVILRGEVDPVLVGAFLTALATRPVTAPLLAAGARGLRKHAAFLPPGERPRIDTCGTGGDGSGTFNVSTAVALVVAAAGGAVAKHGNRGVSSKSGSADVLEAAGCALELRPERAADLLERFGFCFLFAPAYHPAMRHVAPVRRALGMRTLFNLLGPLASPAGASRQLVGVFDPRLTGVVAEALGELGAEAALVVHCDGLDELGLHAPTVGHRLADGEVCEVRVDPASLGLEPAPPGALAAADPEQSLATIRAVLGGRPGPAADLVALNAAAALEVGGLARDIEEGLFLARDVLASSAALELLERYAQASRESGGSAP